MHCIIYIMKRDKLIKIILDLPENAEIMIRRCDDLLGYYHYEDPIMEEQDALKDEKGTFWDTISNFTGHKSKKTKIYSLN